MSCNPARGKAKKNSCNEAKRKSKLMCIIWKMQKKSWPALGTPMATSSQTDLCFMSTPRSGKSNRVNISLHRRESDTCITDNSHSSNILFPYCDNLHLKTWSTSLRPFPARLNELTTWHVVPRSLPPLWAKTIQYHGPKSLLTWEYIAPLK